MFAFFLQLGAAAAVGYGLSRFFWEFALYDIAPGDVVAGTVISFLVFKGLRLFLSPKLARLCVVALLAALVYYIKYQTYAPWNMPIEFAFAEIAGLAALAIGALVFPDRLVQKFVGAYGKRGEPAADARSWAFKGKGFSVYLDFDKGTARLVSRQVYQVEGQQEGKRLTTPTNRQIDETLPLLEFYFDKAEQELETAYVPDVYTTTSGGNVYSTRGPGKVGQIPTGRSYIWFKCYRRKEVTSTSRGLDRETDARNNFTIALQGIDDKECGRFGEAWRAMERVRLMPLRRAAGAQFDARAAQALETAQRAAAEALALEEQRAADAALAAERETTRLANEAGERIAGLLQDSGVAGDFQCAMPQPSGAFGWFMAVDRSGAGVIAVGADVWQGQLAGATAIVGTDASSGKARATLELELPDPAFEEQHLKKRRMRVAPWKSADLLQEWCDRINILAAKKAAA